MKHKSLVVQFWLIIAVTAIILLLTYFKIIPQGAFLHLKNIKNYIEMIYVPLILVIIVSTLKLSKIKQQKNKNTYNNALCFWILGVFLIISAIFYNMFLTIKDVYIAAIICLSMFFVYPNKINNDETNNSNS